MRPPSLVIALLALGCVAGAIGDWRFEQRIVHFRAELDHERSALATDLAAAAKTEADLKAQLTQSRPSAPAGSAPAKPGGPASDPTMDPKARQAAMVAFAKNWLEANSAPMFAHLSKSLGLSDAQIDQLRELNAERAAAVMGALNQARRDGTLAKPDAESVAAVVAPALAGSEQQMKQLLGEAGYAQFQQQTVLAPAEALTQQMSRGLSSEAQLSAAQQDQIAQILVQTQPPATGPFAAYESLNINRDIKITDDAITQAANVLSPDQVQALRSYQAEAQARQTVGKIFGQQIQALTAAAAAAAPKEAGP